jgi:hypothetical protein
MTDRYSKIVLTVIAAALVALVAQNAIGPTRAAGSIQKVAICDAEAPNTCANMMRKGDVILLGVADITR